MHRPVILEGVIRGRPSATITHATQLTLEFRDTVTAEVGRIDACFGEMQDCADPLILGLPEIARWGSTSTKMTMDIFGSPLRR